MSINPENATVILKKNNQLANSIEIMEGIVDDRIAEIRSKIQRKIKQKEQAANNIKKFKILNFGNDEGLNIIYTNIEFEIGQLEIQIDELQSEKESFIKELLDKVAKQINSFQKVKTYDSSQGVDLNQVKKDPKSYNIIVNGHHSKWINGIYSYECDKKKKPTWTKSFNKEKNFIEWSGNAWVLSDQGMMNLENSDLPPRQGWVQSLEQKDKDSVLITYIKAGSKIALKYESEEAALQIEMEQEYLNYFKKLTNKFSTTDINEVYDFGDELGGGWWGKVYKATRKQYKNYVYAIKKQPLRTVKDSMENFVSMTEIELWALQTLDHPNFPRFFECYFNKDYFYFVMEIADGKLFENFEKETGKLSEDEGREIMRQFGSVVHYLHSHGFCHRDLHAGNIIITKDREVKILDLGWTLNMNLPQDQWKQDPHYGCKDFKGNTWKDIGSEHWGLKKAMEIIFESTLLKDKDTLLGSLYSLVSHEKENVITSKQFIEHEWFKQGELVRQKSTQSIISHFKKLGRNKKLHVQAIKHIIWWRTDIVVPMKQLFRDLDVNYTGGIKLEELRKLFVGSIEQEEEINQIFDKMDQNQDGEISYSEFLCGVMSRESVVKEKSLEFAFKNMCDSSDLITVESLKELSRREGTELSLQDIETNLSEIQTQIKNKVTFDEFVTFMQTIE